MTDPVHEKWVHDRLTVAGIEEKDHPHIFTEIAVKKTQDFGYQYYIESVENTKNTDTEDILKRNVIAFDRGEVLISKDDGMPYFNVIVTSLLSNENQTSYLDLVLKDQNGNLINPVKKVISFEYNGKIKILAKIPLDKLCKDFSSLTAIQRYDHFWCMTK